MSDMKGITSKLPDATLRQHAGQSGRSVASLSRELVDAPLSGGQPVYAITADLAGSVSGSRRPAANSRSRFRRS